MCAKYDMKSTYLRQYTAWLRVPFCLGNNMTALFSTSAQLLSSPITIAWGDAHFGYRYRSSIQQAMHLTKPSPRLCLLGHGSVVVAATPTRMNSSSPNIHLFYFEKDGFLISPQESNRMCLAYH